MIMMIYWDSESTAAMIDRKNRIFISLRILKFRLLMFELRIDPLMLSALTIACSANRKVLGRFHHRVPGYGLGSL